MGKVSVITPTIREEGLEIVDIALKRQTFRDFEWLICSPFKPALAGSKWLKDDFTGGVWTLNRVYNLLVKESASDLIISWQDNTFADPDVLDKFVFHHTNEPKTLVTAVGNKYTKVYPELGEKTWQDPRERDDQGTYYKCYFQDIEWNLCSVPKQALYDVGGFDESLDFWGYGMDGYGVNERIGMIGGYDFAIDQTIKSYSLPHGRVKDWDKKNLLNGGYAAKRREYKNDPVLNYLVQNPT